MTTVRTVVRGTDGRMGFRVFAAALALLAAGCVTEDTQVRVGGGIVTTVGVAVE